MSESSLPEPTKPCDACLSGGIIPGSPTGTMDHPDIGGLKYYLAEGKGDKTKAVVLACDIFGLGIPNPKIVADRIAAETGYSVYIPDLLQGEYPPADKLLDPAIDHPLKDKPLLTKASILFSMVGRMLRYVGPRFLIRHRMGVLLPLADTFCKALKEEKGITSLGMLGFCLGGQLSTLYAGYPDCPISVFVVAHPGPLSVNDFTKIHAPYAFLCAQEDIYFDHIKDGALAALAAHPFPTAVYHHPGTTHGFACRPDITDPHLKAEFESASVQTIDWFKAHL